jgi:hypothetical protein
MKRFTPLVFLVIFVSFMSGAWADKPRWQHRDRTVIKLETHGGGYRHGHGSYRHGHGGAGWSPLATVAILGSAVYWANTYSQPSVSTVVVTPSVVYSPPRVAYFCQTSQQYYPVVPVCQVPWQMVNY